MILDTLAESTRKRVEARKLITPLEKIKRKASLVGMGGFEFENALKKDSMAFICEVKKASPSKGIIAERFPYLEIASNITELVQTLYPFLPSLNILRAVTIFFTKSARQFQHLFCVKILRLTNI